MNRIAIKMLVGDVAKYFGILLGITFAALLITQQSSIFVGLMSRTYAFVADTSLPDIWVTDPEVKYIDELEPMQSTALDRVRGVPDVQWARYAIDTPDSPLAARVKGDLKMSLVIDKAHHQFLQTQGSIQQVKAALLKPPRLMYA